MSPRILPALGLLGLLTGCEGPHLEGSVSPLLDLHYESVEAQANEEEVSVSFYTVTMVEGEEVKQDLILEVAARLDDLQLLAGQEFNLAEFSLSRRVQGELSPDFPPILRGALTFQKDLTCGATVPGDFHVTFVNGTNVYSGRTIFGHFEATVPAPEGQACP